MSEGHLFTPDEVAQRMHDAEANRVIPFDEFLTWRSTMKVYLAAPYSRKDEIKGYAEELRAGGVTVTSSWLEEPHTPTTQMQDLTHEEHLKYAVQDVKDVHAAKLLVFFTDPTGTIVRGGRHVEFGIALERRMPIFVIGEQRENIFHHMPGVMHFESWEKVRALLIAMSEPTSA